MDKMVYCHLYNMNVIHTTRDICLRDTKMVFFHSQTNHIEYIPTLGWSKKNCRNADTYRHSGCIFY